MRVLLVVTMITALLIGCANNKNSEAMSRSSSDQKADSLRAYSDSVAMIRNLLSAQSGVHVHNNGDLAANAHQDPKRTTRIRKMQAKMLKSRQEAAARRNSLIQKELEKRKEEGY